MSREVVVLVRCDSCGVTADEGDGVQEAIPIAFDKTSREIDLCVKCRMLADEQISEWLGCARKVPKQAVAKKTAVPAPSGQAPPKVKCPTCKQPFDPRGLAVHRARKHGYRGKR